MLLERNALVGWNKPAASWPSDPSDPAGDPGLMEEHVLMRSVNDDGKRRLRLQRQQPAHLLCWAFAMIIAAER